MDTPTDIQAVAAEALVALDTGHQVAPFSARLSAFDLDDAYCVTTAVRKMREARGELPVGRKIGFTNRTAWTYPPMWGYVYNRTVYDLAEIGETFSLMGLAEPRIEPEIVLKLAVAPAPVMDEGAALMSYWDSSALIKLYVQEFDSAAFRALAAIATRVITASLTRHEMRTVFRRREAEGERIRDLYLRKRRERMRALGHPIVPASLKLKYPSRMLELNLIDHVIIGSPAPGRSSYFSFKEGGVITH